MRPLPEDAVREQNPLAIAGFLDGAGVEEGLVVSHMLHMKAALGASQAPFDMRKCSMRVPVPPLAQCRWIPVRLVAPEQAVGRFFWAAVRTDEAGALHQLRVASTRSSIPQPYIAADEGSPTLAALQSAHITSCVREASGASVQALLEQDPDLRAAWVFDYARPGILLCLEVVPGIPLYAVLRPWANGEWFNPLTLGYAAFREEAPDAANKSALLALAADLCDGDAEQNPHLENIAQNIRERCREHNDKSDGEVLHSDARRATGEQGASFFHLCNLQVTAHAVAAGATVLLDAMHPVLWDALGSPLRVQGDDGRFTETVSAFIDSDKASAYAPVLEAMLLYELPPNVLLSGSVQEHGVFVGVRQYSLEQRRSHVLYICVPTRALCSDAMLSVLEMHGAPCRVVSDTAL